MTLYKLIVNGVPREVEVSTGTSLLEVLRNDLDLKAAKFGCGLGQCGACFVWINGHPTPSCDTPIEYAVGAQIQTLEGLGTEANPHPLQTAFIENQAGQCGYCLSGILMSAAALLRDNPSATRDEVSQALDRNLCRCGTHQRMIDAVMSVSHGAP
ncbi:nicotinate dehydrogenase subunit A [mine drainage metagenome]|uniref:Nicotinate dehydrogenase subunit A n=1 Tax=mine drainage metagenome TaxID=410659 RepID=A0A1J5QK32_9ZZZZ